MPRTRQTYEDGHGKSCLSPAGGFPELCAKPLFIYTAATMRTNPLASLGLIAFLAFLALPTAFGDSAAPSSTAAASAVVGFESRLSASPSLPPAFSETPQQLLDPLRRRADDREGGLPDSLRRGNGHVRGVGRLLDRDA